MPRGVGRQAHPTSCRLIARLSVIPPVVEVGDHGARDAGAGVVAGVPVTGVDGYDLPARAGRLHHRGAAHSGLGVVVVVDEVVVVGVNGARAMVLVVGRIL